MRTLKKTLSLVLVVAMVLGLCVVGASATNKVDGYEDAGKIGAAYTEAVGVMVGLGIVDGVTDTELRPENTYQRDQAAKIIAYMLLGKDKAEKLSCTKAPFEDVPANHWAAGYIAFCKDVGIIDGVTETEFKPTATLTGFQWAKMLLSAVGFGVNGELEGDEWSIKTHVFGNAVNLFDGDTAAATHNALQRQQAMLLAFNVLTDVNVVVWSEALGDYIEGYYTFADRYTYQGTLGENVWKLDSVTGIIIDNEGIGASDTIVDPADPTKANVTVDAGTGLDMMYHAARVWYVVGTKATGATYNTGVYAYDLAKVETTNCPSATAIAALKGNYKTIGEDGVADAVPYQLDVIDNTAIDAGKTNVVFNYYVTARGPVSTAADTTVIGPGNGVGPAVPNSKIMTDISAIDYLDPIIVLYATSTTQKVSDGAYAYYVYSPTATSGVITKVADNGTVTLRDGTVIAKSNLATESLDKDDVGVSYTFTLDTHGHWIKVSANLNLVYYTGAYTRDTYGDYAGEYVYNAQVVGVTSGEPSLVRVTGSWFGKHGVVDTISNMEAGYYWLGEANLAGVYSPKAWKNAYDYLGGYVHGTTATFVNTSGIKTISEDSTGFTGNVYYTGDSVKFIIATGKGTNLDIKTYNGVAELIAGYNVSGATTGSVTLKDMALTTYVTKYNNVDTTVVFAYAAATSSKYVFVPYNVSDSDWDYAFETATGTKLYCYSGEAYLNGKPIDIYYSAKAALERGFYTYDTDTAGVVTINPTFHVGNWVYEDEDLISAGSTIAQISETLGKNVYFAEDLVVVDLREGVIVTKDVDAIETLEDIEYYGEPNLQLAYTLNAAGQIDVCYVVEQNLGVVDVTSTARTGGDSPAGYTVSNEKLYEDKVVATLELPDGVTVAEKATFVVAADLEYASGDGRTFTSYGDGIKGTGVANADGDIVVTFTLPADVRGTYAYKVKITDVVFAPFEVSTTTKGFTIRDADDETGVLTVDDLKPGAGLDLKFFKEAVAAGLTIDFTVNDVADETTSYNGYVQLIFNRSTGVLKTITKNDDLVINFTVDYTFNLGADGSTAAENYNFFKNDGSVIANYDEIEVNGVIPGEVVTFLIQRSNKTTTADKEEGRLLIITTTAGATGLDGETTLKSLEAAYIKESSNQVFTFKFVPVANEDSVNQCYWSAEKFPPLIPEI